MQNDIADVLYVIIAGNQTLKTEDCFMCPQFLKEATLVCCTLNPTAYLSLLVTTFIIKKVNSFLSNYYIEWIWDIDFEKPVVFLNYIKPDYKSICLVMSTQNKAACETWLKQTGLFRYS